MTLVLAIRPQPGCGATVAAGSDFGLAIEACPLSDIRPLAWTLPAGRFDGLLLGSANGLRHAGPLLERRVDLPVFAVGEATAAAARERGFSVVCTGSGGLQTLLDELAGKHFRLLRIAGREHVPLSPPAGIVVETAIAYESVPLPLPQAWADRLREGALVLLHSAAAAGHFAGECERLGLGRAEIALAALAPRIAAAAGPGWRAVRAADEPNEAALLARAREMCHEPRSG